MVTSLMALDLSKMALASRSCSVSVSSVAVAPRSEGPSLSCVHAKLLQLLGQRHYAMADISIFRIRDIIISNGSLPVSCWIRR